MQRTIQFGKEHNFIIENKAKAKQKHPPWSFTNNSLDLSLVKWQKDSTNRCIFMSEYQEIIENHKNKIFLYTDGSKTQSDTAYSIIIKQDNQTLTVKTALLPSYAAVFSEEAEAILAACEQL